MAVKKLTIVFMVLQPGHIITTGVAGQNNPFAYLTLRQLAGQILPLLYQ